MPRTNRILTSGRAACWYLACLSLTCSVHIIDEGQEQKTASEVLSKEYSLDVISAPSESKPAATLRSSKKTRTRDTFSRTATFKRQPSPLFTLGLASLSLGGFVLAADMSTRGWPEYARPTETISWLGLGTAGLLYLGSKVLNWHKTTRTALDRERDDPSPIEVTISSKQLGILRPDGSCRVSLDLNQFVQGLPEGEDFRIAARMVEKPSESCSIPVSSILVRQWTEEARKRLEDQTWQQACASDSVSSYENYVGQYPSGRYADSARVRQEAARVRLQREENAGLLVGMFPNAQGIPAKYLNARIVDSADVGRILASANNDALTSRYNTDLERELFLQSAEAESIKAALLSKRAGLTGKTYVLRGRRPAFFPNYDIKLGAFKILLEYIWSPDPEIGQMGLTQDESDFYMMLARHVLRGVLWVDQLPRHMALASFANLGVDISQGMTLAEPDKKKAVGIEESGYRLEFWLGFELTGAVKEVSPTGLAQFSIKPRSYLVARDIKLILIDPATGEVLWTN